MDTQYSPRLTKFTEFQAQELRNMLITDKRITIPFSPGRKLTIHTTYRAADLISILQKEALDLDLDLTHYTLEVLSKRDEDQEAYYIYTLTFHLIEQ